MSQLLPSTDFYSQISQLQSARMEQTRALHAFNMGTTDGNNTFINPEIAGAIVRQPVTKTVDTNRRFIPKQPIHRTADGNGALYDIRNNSVTDTQKHLLMEQVRKLGQEKNREGYKFTEDERMNSVISMGHEYDVRPDYNQRHNMREQAKNSTYLQEQRKRQQDAYGAGMGLNRGETRYDANIHRDRMNSKMYAPKYNLDGMGMSNIQMEMSGNGPNVKTSTDASDDNFLRYDARSSIGTITALTKNGATLTDTQALTSKPVVRNQNTYSNFDNHVVFSENTQREQFDNTPTKHIVKNINDSVNRAVENNVMKKATNRFVETASNSATPIKRSVIDRSEHTLLPSTEYFEQKDEYSLFDRVTDVISSFFNTTLRKQKKEAYDKTIKRDTAIDSAVAPVASVQRGLERNSVITSRNIEQYVQKSPEQRIREHSDMLRQRYYDTQQPILYTVMETGNTGTSLQEYDIFHSLIYDKQTGDYILAQTLKKRDQLGVRKGVVQNNYSETTETDIIIHEITLDKSLVEELSLKTDLDKNRFKKYAQENNKMLTDDEITRRLVQNIVVYVDKEQDRDARIQRKKTAGIYNRHAVTKKEIVKEGMKHTARASTDVVGMEAKTQRQQKKVKMVSRNDITPHDVANNTFSTGGIANVAQYNNIIFGSR